MEGQIGLKLKFKSLDPDFETKIRKSFSYQGALATMGGELALIEPGHCILEMPYSKAVTQQHGFIHAGVLTTMMDSAAGYAAFTLMPAEAEVLTIEFKTSLMHPAKGERFRFEGRVIKPGRTIMFCEADAFAINPSEPDKKVASLTATMMVVTGRDDIKR